MGSFKDKTGHDWLFHISVGSIKRCQDLCKLSPLDIVKQDSDLLAELPANPEMLANVLYACCKPEADAQHITDEQFGELLNADSLDDGWEALKIEVVGFSQKSKRPLLKLALSKQQEIETRTVELAMAKMNDPRVMQQIEAEMESRMDAALHLNGLTPATNAPASSELLQTTSATANST
jgi:hypothetical protein